MSAHFLRAVCLDAGDSGSIRCWVRVTDQYRRVAVVEICPATIILEPGDVVELIDEPDEQYPVIGRILKREPAETTGNIP